MQKKRTAKRQDKMYIYGRHALVEALRHTPKVIRKVFLANDLKDTELRKLLAKNTIPVNILASGKGKELVGKDAVHQGVIAVMDPSSLLISFDEFLTTLPDSRSAKIAIAILAVPDTLRVVKNSSKEMSREDGSITAMTP